MQKVVHTLALLVIVGLFAAGSANAAQDELTAASTAGDLSRVKALLASGADVNARIMTDGPAKGGTALMSASSLGHPDVVRALLAAGADVNAQAAVNGGTALMSASVGGKPEVVRALLAAGADVNARMTDRAGRDSTALMLASAGGTRRWCGLYSPRRPAAGRGGSIGGLSHLARR